MVSAFKPLVGICDSVWRVKVVLSSDDACSLSHPHCLLAASIPDRQQSVCRQKQQGGCVLLSSLGSIVPVVCGHDSLPTWLVASGVGRWGKRARLGLRTQQVSGINAPLSD